MVRVGKGRNTIRAAKPSEQHTRAQKPDLRALPPGHGSDLSHGESLSASPCPARSPATLRTEQIHQHCVPAPQRQQHRSYRSAPQPQLCARGAAPPAHKRFPPPQRGVKSDVIPPGTHRMAEVAFADVADERDLGKVGSCCDARPPDEHPKPIDAACQDRSSQPTRPVKTPAHGGQETANGQAHGSPKCAWAIAIASSSREPRPGTRIDRGTTGPRWPASPPRNTARSGARRRRRRRRMGRTPGRGGSA